MNNNNVFDNLDKDLNVRYNVHMKKTKRKSITELRNTIFETFDEVAAGRLQIVTHKNGNEIAMISMEKIDELYQEIELHKNLAIGYAQALRGEGLTSSDLKSKFNKKLKN